MVNALNFNVRQSYCARYWYRLDVCPSVCLSVTRWYCVEMAQPIVKLSSLPGSSMILVFWRPNFSRNSNRNTPVMQGGRKKVAISDWYLAIARKQLKIDGYMLLCVWPALNPLSIHVTFTAFVPGHTQDRPKCAKMC